MGALTPVLIMTLGLEYSKRRLIRLNFRSLDPKGLSSKNELNYEKILGSRVRPYPMENARLT